MYNNLLFLSLISRFSFYDSAVLYSAHLLAALNIKLKTVSLYKAYHISYTHAQIKSIFISKAIKNAAFSGGIMFCRISLRGSFGSFHNRTALYDLKNRFKAATHLQ